MSGSGLVDLGQLDAASGFVVRGAAAGDFSGAWVASAGDVNSDGYDDLVIGADFADPFGRSNAGEAYVVFGGAGVGSGGVVDVSLLDGSSGFVLRGVSAGDYSGRVVASAGDVNGDGFGDLLIGAYAADPGGVYAAGVTYVVFGSATVGAGGGIDLGMLDGANGFAIEGQDEAGFSGCAVSSAGDVNGDGIADLLIGADRTGPAGQPGAGRAFVVFGGLGVGASGRVSLGSLSGSDGFAMDGVAAQDASGFSVSSAGDVNGDGYGDVLIGAYGADPNNRLSAGEAYVVFGGPSVGSGGVVGLGQLDGTNGFEVLGITAGDRCGASVSSAGDVNGDGFADLLVGCYGGDPGSRADAGEAYVIYGWAGIGGTGRLALGTLDGSVGLVLNGAAAGDLAGIAVSSAGDLNGDGIGDFAIGAYRADVGGLADAGETYVVFGRDAVSCRVDVVEDGELNLFDILEFFGRFGAGAREADFTGDATLNVFDILKYFEEFGLGCG